MKNAKRVLAFASMTLAAGALLGISPAQAAPDAPNTTSKTAAASSGPYWDWDDEYVVGYYDNPWECKQAGWWGKRTRAWSNYYCFDVWYPGWGRVWVLQVQENDWYWNNWNGGWPKSWPHKPKYFGKPFTVGGAYDHPFKWKQGIRWGNLNGLPGGPWKGGWPHKGGHPHKGGWPDKGGYPDKGGWPDKGGTPVVKEPLPTPPQQSQPPAGPPQSQPPAGMPQFQPPAGPQQFQPPAVP